MYAHRGQGTVAFRFCDTSPTSVQFLLLQHSALLAHVTCTVARFASRGLHYITGPWGTVLHSQDYSIHDASAELLLCIPAAYAAPLPDSDANFSHRPIWYILTGRAHLHCPRHRPYHVAKKKFP
jgi:hypothetical protein